MIKAELSGISAFLAPDWREKWLPRVADAMETLREERDHSGWLHLPSRTDAELIGRINAAADEIHSRSEVLLVIGIGGSYLGARAATELLCPAFSDNGCPRIIFAGNNLSPQYVSELKSYLAGRDFSINVISKSGTTTEPAVAFRIFYELLREKYGAKAAERVYATTDAEHGALRSMAEEQGFRRFVIPADTGGRYSVLTPVGLLPMAAAGISIADMLSGAKAAEAEYLRKDPENPAMLYAAARQALYASGKKIEALSVWEPRFRFFAEWWKQLFGESEGKDGRGIFPAALELSADLHSMGQYMQQGERLMLETMLYAAPSRSVVIPTDGTGADGLEHLSGRELDDVNRAALEGTLAAHVSGGVPCIRLDMPPVTAASAGNLFYFFELSCALSAYVSGVCPFDQPGVEEYKTLMFALLGKT